MRAKRAVLFGLASLVLFSLSCLPSGPLFDFGDAPDPTFPTLLASNGARTQDITHFWLGAGTEPSVDAEPEARLVNQDQLDDGLRDRGAAVMRFLATRSPDSSAGIAYFNLLVDLNSDGRWGGTFEGEWVAINIEVDLAPGESETIEVEFPFGLAEGVWMRATLTNKSVPQDQFPDGWDGSGLFEFGEVEDYFFESTSLTPSPEETYTPEETPVETPIYTPEPERVFTDPASDTFACGAQTKIPYAAADILEVRISSTEKGMIVKVFLAQPADLSLQKEWSWAVLFAKQDKNGQLRPFLMEIHDGVIRKGELDDNGNIIPGTEEMVDVEGGQVVFRPDQKLEDTLRFFVQAFNSPEEGDQKGCDETATFELNDQGQLSTEDGMQTERPQVTRIASAVEPIDNTQVKITFTVTATPADYNMCGTITGPDGVRSGCVTDEDGDGMVVFSHITSTTGQYDFAIDTINNSPDFGGLRDSTASWEVSSGS